MNAVLNVVKSALKAYFMVGYDKTALMSDPRHRIALVGF
jgi:hypothetical protein